MMYSIKKFLWNIYRFFFVNEYRIFKVYCFLFGHRWIEFQVDNELCRVCPKCAKLQIYGVCDYYTIGGEITCYPVRKWITTTTEEVIRFIDSKHEDVKS